MVALETAVVAVGVMAAIRFLNMQPALHLRWLAVPCLLVTAALLPTWLRKDEFPPVGLDRRHVATSLRWVGLACLCTLPAAFLGLWLMVRMQLPIPLKPVTPGPDGWIAWLVYQFLYVAVAEELFFRGYFQTNVTRLLAARHKGPQDASPYVAIMISAAYFALAHVVVQDQITSVFTFLPGLIMAWLFLRTHSLLAPILFHGLANISYGVMALVLM